MQWDEDGQIAVLECNSADCSSFSYNQLRAYELDSWQSVQLDIDLTADRYDISWAQNDDALQLLHRNAQFRHGSLESLDAFSVTLFLTGPWGLGEVYVDNVSVTVLPQGDFNTNGVLDIHDIDELASKVAVGTHPASHDLTADNLVNDADISRWVTELFGSWLGDANLDGEFNSTDLVAVLASGTYESNVVAVWSTGDFNGDARTNSADLVVALTDGGYEAAPVRRWPPYPSRQAVC